MMHVRRILSVAQFLPMTDFGAKISYIVIKYYKYLLYKISCIESCWLLIFMCLHFMIFHSYLHENKYYQKNDFSTIVYGIYEHLEKVMVAKV